HPFTNFIHFVILINVPVFQSIEFLKPNYLLYYFCILWLSCYNYEAVTVPKIVVLRGCVYLVVLVPVCVVDGTNGAAVVDGVYPSQHHLRQSVRSKQSFKSALSTHTFKTARSRARTVSCQTINDDLEADMHSVEGSNVECHSVEEADPQCYSVASSSTFKSDEDMQSAIDGVASVTEQQGQQFGYMLSNGVTTDKTAAWLSSHHDLATMSDSQRIQPPATKKEIHANNSVYGLFW
ncbi:hypothetical protein OTU49_014771, partial [Cherax quadricarinatus]